MGLWPWDGIGKVKHTLLSIVLTPLLTSSLALKDIFCLLSKYISLFYFFNDWEISHISCCCCRFSFLVFTVTLSPSPSIPPNLSLSETLITMVESNPPRRLNVHQALGGGSGPLSLSLSPNLCIHIHIHHAYIHSYVWIYVYYTLIHESDSCFLIDCHNWFSFLVFLLIDWLYIV